MTKTKYMVTITSFSGRTMSIRHTLKKSDELIKKIKWISTQKTPHKNNRNEIDFKFLHNFIILAIPSADLKKIYANLINNDDILDVCIRLL